jgi:hypothetical protein
LFESTCAKELLSNTQRQTERDIETEKRHSTRAHAYFAALLVGKVLGVRKGEEAEERGA